LWQRNRECAKFCGERATPARLRDLHETHSLFLEIGAPIRAEQVAKELAG
jgi:hypothetical protein